MHQLGDNDQALSNGLPEEEKGGALPQRSRKIRDKRMDQQAITESIAPEILVSNERSSVEPILAVDSKPADMAGLDKEITTEVSEHSTHDVPPVRKGRDKTLDSYASMAATNQKSLGGSTSSKQGANGVSQKQPANAGMSNNFKGPGKPSTRNSNSFPESKFSSAAIPRDHRKYNPQGWVQAEFSDRQLSSDRSRTKEDIKNLERAWQLRIDLDVHKADELEKKLIACQEIVGAFAANMSITSRELRQNFQLLEPLKVLSQEAFDTKERCSADLRKMSDVYSQRAREDTFEDCKSLANNNEVRRLRSGADIDKYVNKIESELETSLAGSDARFLMLKDKPNISSGGLRKVTNDSSALLRAEKDAIRKVQELRKVAPAVEKRYEDKVALDQQRQKLEHEREQAQEKLKAIATERQKIRDRITELKQIEERQRIEFEALDKERNEIRGQISNLRLEIRAELAERNKQRERYRFVLAQEEELQLRHQLRQDEIAGVDESELRNQLEAVESARLAKEEAEAHARMLQSTIARFERLKAEVEGFLQPVTERTDSDLTNTWQSFGNVSETNANAAVQMDVKATAAIQSNGCSSKDSNDATSKPGAGGDGPITTSRINVQSSKVAVMVRDIGNATPLTLPTVDESETFKDTDEVDGDQLYRQVYNSQIYTPSMGDRVRGERYTNSEFLESDDSGQTAYKTAIPVFKALNFASKSSSDDTSRDEVPLAPEFEDELKATMERLFEIKQAQEEKSKPGLVTTKAVVKQRVSKMEQEDSDDSADESIAPLGKIDPAFEAYQKEVSQDINIAEIREKERLQREIRVARRLQTSASQDSAKKKNEEQPKSQNILSALFTTGIATGQSEREQRNDGVEASNVKEKPKSANRPSKRGRKKRNGSKHAHGDSDDDGGSDHEDSVLAAQAEARKLALAKVKRKEADRRFWRTVAFYSALAVLGSVFMYALYESMSEPVGGRQKQMTPAQRSRMMTSGAYQGPESTESAGDAGAAHEDSGDSKMKREPLLQIQILGQDQKPLPETLNIYHGLGDPEGVRNDVRAFTRKYRIMREGELHLYNSVIEQLQNRVRGQVPTGGVPTNDEDVTQESDVNDEGDDSNSEDEEEVSDPEEAEMEQESRDHWYEDEDEDEGVRPGPTRKVNPEPVRESPAAASGSRGWQNADNNRLKTGHDNKKGPAAAPQMPRSTPQMPRAASSFERARGSNEDKAPPTVDTKKDTVRKPEAELKIKTANGEYLPPFPVFADSTQESLIQQVSNTWCMFAKTH